MKRIAALAALLTALFVAAGAGLVTTEGRAAPLPTRLDLPAGYQPEGIALYRGMVIVGSIPTGAVTGIDPRTDASRTIVPGRPGTAAIGLKADSRGRIFVAGGPTGKAFVYDGRTGRELASFQLNPTANTFINDVTIFGNEAYFTDSLTGVIHAVRRDLSGVRDIPVPDIPLEPGINLNGIAATRDGRYLLAIQTPTGALWRIDRFSGAARKIDLGGSTLVAGDGILLERHKLYVVQNQFNRIAVVQLAPRFDAGRILRTISSDELDVPTTIVRKGGDFFLPNARFGIPSPETAAYWVTRVPAG